MTNHAFRGPSVLPVPKGVTARLECPVTMRQGAVGARLDSRGLAARNPVLLACSGKTAASCANVQENKSSAIL